MKMSKNIPTFIYGTAWKENETERLTHLALKAGYLGIDTANQRCHYLEAGVGAAVTRFLSENDLTRHDLFLQTKFTFMDGQDHRLPYDPEASITTQVRQSFTSSLEHLQTDYIDSYVLHGPSRPFGLASADREAWQEMEAIFQADKIRYLGVSNVDLQQLIRLYEMATVKPAFVQNRCYATTGWDRAVRKFCREMKITYQGFSILTANRQVVTSVEVADIARFYEKTPAQVVFRFARQIGMLPLTGTTSPAHMRQDLEIDDFKLEPDQMLLVETLAEK